MKGPLVFGISLVAVAVLALVLVMPGLEGAPPPDAPPTRPDARYDAAADHLGHTLGLVRGENGSAYEALFDRLGNEFGMVQRSGGGGVGSAAGATEGVLVISWDRLPALLTSLATTRAPVLESLAAEADPETDACRVTLRLRPLPRGFTVP